MILLDTNIIIYLSKGLIDIDKVINNENEIYSISIITYMEVLGYTFEDEEEKNFIKEFLNYLEIIDVDMKIANKVIELKEKYKIKLPDAIICATALVYKADLITNDKYLQKIFGKFKK